MPVVSCCLRCSLNPWWTKGKLEENSRSCRNCRCVYSLLAGTAAVAADTLYFSSCGWPNRHSRDTAVVTQPQCCWHNITSMQPQCRLRWSVYVLTAQSSAWPSEYLVRLQAQCYKWSRLLHNHYPQNMGQELEAVDRESLTTPSWLICSFPTDSKLIETCENLCYWK